ncbi:Arb2 domain-containing protein isoform 2 [Cladophialophora immunda]|nr:Arb2 domain-containing protein isoform 2 [Cladophialophora immunda]
MFRRLPHTLPADPVFEPDLAKLGFFLNSEDQVRSISSPDRKWQYKINRNERWNEVHKWANNTAIRKIIYDRLADLGCETVRLPLGAGESENHVPIIVSKDIATKARVTVFFGERNIEPGILTWRVIGERGLSHGSLVEFSKALLSVPVLETASASAPTSTFASVPGLIVANPCQLLWYRGGGRAVSTQEWLGLPRASAVHEAPRVDSVKNSIPGNRTYVEHVSYMFEKAIPSLVDKDAKLDLIGLEYTGSAVLEYLAEHWETWSGRINGISLVAPQHKVADLIADGAPSNFITFLSRRCRAYFVSQSPVETPIAGRQEFGCNCYASGEHSYQESAIVSCWRHILDWFNMLYVNQGHEEVEFEVMKEDEEVKLGW